MPEQVGLAVPGELEHAATDRDDASVVVTDDEGRVGARVVVLEQLEQEPEAALRAADGLVAQPLAAILVDDAPLAVRADEERHWPIVGPTLSAHAEAVGTAVRFPPPLLWYTGWTRRVTVRPEAASRINPVSSIDQVLAVPAELEEERDLEQRARPYRALYEHWEANQWSPLDIDLGVDAESFRSLQEDERQGLMWIFAHRFHAEFNVATVLAPFVMRAPDYELQACLATQLADEFRHLQCVLRVYDEVFGIRGLQRVQAVADAHLDPVATTLYERARALRPAARDLDRPGRLPAGCRRVPPGRRGRRRPNGAEPRRRPVRALRLVPGLAAGQRLVARDEARHIGIGVSYVRRRLAEDREQAVAAVDEVVEEFGALATRLLETALSDGMDTQVLAGYGVEARGFYDEAMRLWQMRLRSIGYLD